MISNKAKILTSEHSIISVSISPNGNKLVIALDNGDIEIFNIDDQTNTKLGNKGELLRHMTVDWDYLVLSAAYADKSVKLWDLRD